MSARFVPIDRDTPMLLPPDLRDWVDESDIVHFILEAVHRLPLEHSRSITPAAATGNFRLT